MAPTPAPKGGPSWGRISKNLSFWILVLLIPVAFFQFKGAAGQAGEINYTRF